MGYRYEMYDRETEAWIRVKAPEIKKNMRVKIIDENEKVIAEGLLKDLNRLWIKEEDTNGIEHMYMHLEMEFVRAPEEEEVYNTVFPPTCPPWQGKVAGS